MGYEKEVKVEEKKPEETFNSLYGILMVWYHSRKFDVMLSIPFMGYISEI
jgi:hypothetical protein